MAGTSEYYDGFEARGIDANLRISFAVRIVIGCVAVPLVLYLQFGVLEILAVLVDVSCVPAEAQGLRSNLQKAVLPFGASSRTRCLSVRPACLPSDNLRVPADKSEGFEQEIRMGLRGCRHECQRQHGHQ
jgi:hypothetical protein